MIEADTLEDEAALESAWRARPRRPRETALRHDNQDHAAFGEAMVACKGFAPACSDAGACMADGDCFDPDQGWNAVRRIRHLADLESRPGVAFQLRRAASLLSAELSGGEALRND